MARCPCESQGLDLGAFGGAARWHRLRHLNEPGIQSDEDVPSVDQRWTLIQRVTASEQFSRAARLREFLLYGRSYAPQKVASAHASEEVAEVQLCSPSSDSIGS